MDENSNKENPIFMPLQKILCYKQPYGIYKVIIIKADSNEPPIEILVDGTIRYCIIYNLIDIKEIIGDDCYIISVECSDGSDPDQYCQCIDEGFYHRLPNKIEPFEIDNPVQLMIVTDIDDDYINLNCDGIKSTGVSVNIINKYGFMDRIWDETQYEHDIPYTFKAVEEDNDIVWYIYNDNYFPDGMKVNLDDYYINIIGTPSEGDSFTTIIYLDKYKINASDVLDILNVNDLKIILDDNGIKTEGVTVSIEDNSEFISTMVYVKGNPKGTYTFKYDEDVWYMYNKYEMNNDNYFPDGIEVNLNEFHIVINGNPPSIGDSFIIKVV